MATIRWRRSVPERAGGPAGGPARALMPAQTAMVRKNGRDISVTLLPLREIGQLLRARKVTSLQLTQMSLTRLGTLGGRYNAVVTLIHDSAIRAARQADRELESGKDR